MTRGLRSPFINLLFLIMLKLNLNPEQLLESHLSLDMALFILEQEYKKLAENNTNDDADISQMESLDEHIIVLRRLLRELKNTYLNS